MDITIYILLIIAITILFILLKYSLNVFIYATIIVLACLGLVLLLETGATIQTGTIATVTYDPIVVTTVPQTIDLGNWKYVLNLSFLSFLIGSIIYWSTDNPKQNNDD